MRDKAGYDYRRKVYVWLDHTDPNEPKVLKCRTNLLICWEELTSGQKYPVLTRIKELPGIFQSPIKQYIESYNVFVKRFREREKITVLISRKDKVDQKITIEQFCI